jgi:hypothetical protein
LFTARQQNNQTHFRAVSVNPVVPHMPTNGLSEFASASLENQYYYICIEKYMQNTDQNSLTASHQKDIFNANHDSKFTL